MADGVEEHAEWEGRLEGLRGQHRREMVRQQEAHLRQLQALQTQLLQELAPSLLTGELQPHRHQWVDGAPAVIHSLPGTAAQDHAALHDTSDPVPSPNQSLDFLELPPSHCPGAIPDASRPGADDQRTSPPHMDYPHSSPISSPQPVLPTALQSHTPTTQASRSPASHQVSHSTELSAAPKSAKLPVFPVGSYTPGVLTHSLPPAQWPMASPVTFASYLKSPIPATPPLASQPPPTMLHQQVGGSRAALMEKHSRHIEDLRTFYEAELAALRRELERKREEPLPLSSSPREGPKVGSGGAWGESELRGELEEAKM